MTYWTFEDTLTQIGLGYTFLFLLAFTSLRVQVGVFVAILVGFWLAFVLYPLPPADFNYPAVGVPANWPHLYTGFLAHFNMNSNLSWAFDTWFLNLFPRESPFLLQRRRLVHAELRPHAGDDAARHVTGDVAEGDEVACGEAARAARRRRRAGARRPPPAVARASARSSSASGPRPTRSTAAGSSC